MKERMRHIRADVEAADSDGEDEPWARKPIADRLGWLVLWSSSGMSLILSSEGVTGEVPS